MQLFLLNSLHPFLFFRASSFTDHSHYLRIHALLHSAIVLCERFDWRDIHTAAIVFYRCRPSCHVRLQHYGEELLLIDLILCQMVNTIFYWRVVLNCSLTASLFCDQIFINEKLTIALLSLDPSNIDWPGVSSLEIQLRVLLLKTRNEASCCTLLIEILIICRVLIIVWLVIESLRLLYLWFWPKWDICDTRCPCMLFLLNHALRN